MNIGAACILSYSPDIFLSTPDQRQYNYIAFV